jgi:oligopeptidase B
MMPRFSSRAASLLLGGALVLACSSGVTSRPAAAPTAAPSAAARPPVAKVVPYRLEAHGDVRVDDYYWLKERTNAEVIAYLEAENTYTDTVMKPTAALRDTLFAEITGRLKQDDASVPYREDGYYYYTRFETGKEYPLYCRKRETLTAAEEVMLDGNVLAQGHGFFAVTGWSVSSGNDVLAFATDTVGRRIATLRFKSLTTGELFPDTIPDVAGNVAWALDNQTVFYSRQDLTTLRPYRVYRHTLGSDPTADALVYEEKDQTYRCRVERSKSRRFLFIASNTTLADEVRFLPADQPEGEWRVMQPRERGREYGVEHFGDSFYIRTNDGAKNFRLMKTSVAAPSRPNWIEVIPHREDVYLEGFDIFRDYLVLAERKGGLMHLRVKPWAGGGEHELDFGEPAYLAYVSANPEIDTSVLRFGYTSMTTPRSTYDYDMVTRTRTLLKRDEVVGGFDPAAYVTERLHATARDGVQVPISIVYRKDLVRDGRAPLLLYGYGSYGASMDASFDVARLSLLDRGFAYAIAHIRGGAELGRGWYEDGKLLKKKNTFTDFIDCAEFLVAKRYTSPDRMFAHGGSAGGLLIGAVYTTRPDLFKGMVAAVPFVDVVTTMLDASIPLTTDEYDEWGNPNEKAYYDYMLSYSPYDQTKRRAYTNLLVTTSLHDSQVQYFEPAKWVAKLRALKTDPSLVLLHTTMEAGHGGASGRFRRYRETALIYSFFLDLAGIGREEAPK